MLSLPPPQPKLVQQYPPSTLLLVLSLILTILAMLSLPLPSQSSSSGTAPGDPVNEGVWSGLTHNQSQALITWESNVGVHEAKVTQCEAEILASVAAACG